MRLKAGMLFLFLSLAVLAAAPALAGSKPAAKTAAADAASAAASAAPKAAKPVATELTGDAAYKSNCMRCHGEPRKFSERAMKTIMRHMRVRANLTDKETELILEYLTR